MNKYIKNFWIWFHKKYGYDSGNTLSAPIDIICNTELLYYLHDKEDNVKYGTRTMLGAVIKHYMTGLYITRIH